MTPSGFCCEKIKQKIKPQKTGGIMGYIGKSRYEISNLCFLYKNQELQGGMHAEHLRELPVITVLVVHLHFKG